MNLDLFQEIMRDDYGQKMTMYDNSRVFTPEKIAKQMVDMLPDQVWDPKTKFLDPCCKTGVFLIEIYNKLDEALQKLPDYSDKSKRRNHILNNQIFGIALDDESLVYSRRNVAGDTATVPVEFTYVNMAPIVDEAVEEYLYEAIGLAMQSEEVTDEDMTNLMLEILAEKTSTVPDDRITETIEFKLVKDGREWKLDYFDAEVSDAVIDVMTCNMRESVEKYS